MTLLSILTTTTTTSLQNPLSVGGYYEQALASLEQHLCALVQTHSTLSEKIVEVLLETCKEPDGFPKILETFSYHLLVPLETDQLLQELDLCIHDLAKEQSSETLAARIKQHLRDLVDTIVLKLPESPAHPVLTKEKIKKSNRQIELIYFGKKGTIPEFVAHAAKTEGCAWGTIYVKAPSKPSREPWRWLGKVGDPKELLQNNPGTWNTRTLNEINLDTAREKVAYDLYGVFGRGLFILPKTRLSEQSLLNKFPQSKKSWVMRNVESEGKIKETLRIMSRYIDKYQNFQLARIRNADGNVISFIEFILKMRRPPTHLVTDEGDEVPLHGLIELLCVSRILADTDSLGGEADNAGFIWVYDKDGKITHAKAVKIDPGCVFNFTHDKNSSVSSFNWVHNTLYELSGCGTLKNIKDLQVAQQRRDITLHWDALTIGQKDQFLAILLNASHYLDTPDLLDYLFYRDGKFHKDDNITLPKGTADIFKEEMRDWLKLQIDIYQDELQIFQQKQALKAHYTHAAGMLTIPLRKKPFPIYQLFSQLALVDSTNNPVILENLFEKQQTILLIGEAKAGKQTLCQKITTDWALGKLWSHCFDAVYALSLEALDPDWIGDDPYAFFSSAINSLPFQDPIATKSLCIQIEKGQKKALLILNAYDAANDDLTQKLTSLLKKTPFCILWISQEKTNALEVDQIVRNIAFSNVHPQSYHFLQKLFEAKAFPSAEILAQKALKLLPPTLPPNYIPSYHQFKRLYIYKTHPTIGVKFRIILNRFAEAYRIQDTLILQDQCLKAIDSDPCDAYAYNNLANTLSSGSLIPLLNGSSMSKQALYLKAIDLDPNFAFAYNNLATTVSSVDPIQLLNGSSMSKQALYLKAIDLDPNFAFAYNNLATTVSSVDPIQLLNGSSMSKQALFLKAIDLNPNDAYAYHNLAYTFSSGGSISLPNGSSMSQQALFLKAIDLDPNYAKAYYNLATTVSSGGSIQLLNGSSMSRQALYLKTIDLDPNCAHAYYNLAKTLSSGGSIQLLNGSSMSKQDLYLKAIDLNPNYAKAYHNLSRTLSLGSSIPLLNGSVMSKQQLRNK